VIGRLLVGPEIGRGGYAIVRQALEPDQGRQLAWKELREEKARQAHLATAHQAEAWILSSTSHPSIPHIYAYLREYHAFVMDFVPGLSLDRLMDRWGTAPMDVRSRLVTELVGAVVEIHRRGFLHLDLKLANLLLTPHGNLYLVDFGVAALHWMNTHAGTRFALPISAGYAAPELVASRPVYDQRAEVYSLAVVIYVLLTGRRPYRIEQANIDETRAAIDAVHARGIPTLRSVMPAIPLEVESVVLGGMRHDPAKRPPTVMAFGKRLVAALRSVGMADMAAMEKWAADVLAEVGGENGIPKPWDGADPLLQLSLEEEALAVAEPVLVTRVDTLEVEPETVSPGGEVLVRWSPAMPGEEYELAVLGPGDIRPRTMPTRSCPHLLFLEQVGSYRLHVRAVNEGLRGAWSPEVTVEVLRPGLDRRVLFTAGGLAAMAMVAVLVIFLMTGRLQSGQEPLRTPTPAAVAVGFSPVPSPATYRGRERKDVWFATPRPVATFRPVPTDTPVPEAPTATPSPTTPPTPMIAQEVVPTQESVPPVVPSTLLAGRTVRVISTGGWKLVSINGVDRSVRGRKLRKSFEKLDGSCLKAGMNTVWVRRGGQQLDSGSMTERREELNLTEYELKRIAEGQEVRKQTNLPGHQLRIKLLGTGTGTD